MKKILLVLAGFLPLFASGQTVIITDDFESYTAGEPLAANSPLWTTWSGGTASEDADVSDAQASSGVNSLYVVGNTGPTDLILPFPEDYSAGVFEFALKLYVVAGKGAYFNLQQSSVPGVAWMFELYLDNAGGGDISAGGASAAPVTYTPEEWNDVKVTVDLGNDLAEFFMNGSSIYSWQWSLAADGSGADTEFGGVDIFAYAFAAQDAEFYIDDVTLTQLDATGINEENEVISMQVFPNPSNGHFSVVMNDLAAGEYQFELMDVLGKVITREKTAIAGTYKKNFDLDLSSGIYFVKVSDGINSTTRKLMVD